MESEDDDDIQFLGFSIPVETTAIGDGALTTDSSRSGKRPFGLIEDHTNPPFNSQRRRLTPNPAPNSTTLGLDHSVRRRTPTIASSAPTDTSSPHPNATSPKGPSPSSSATSEQPNRDTVDMIGKGKGRVTRTTAVPQIDQPCWATKTITNSKPSCRNGTGRKAKATVDLDDDNMESNEGEPSDNEDNIKPSDSEDSVESSDDQESGIMNVYDNNSLPLDELWKKYADPNENKLVHEELNGAMFKVCIFVFPWKLLEFMPTTSATSHPERCQSMEILQC